MQYWLTYLNSERRRKRNHNFILLFAIFWQRYEPLDLAPENRVKSLHTLQRGLSGAPLPSPGSREAHFFLDKKEHQGRGRRRRRHAPCCLMPCTRCLHEAFKGHQWIPPVAPLNLPHMYHLSISTDRQLGRLNSLPQVWVRSLVSL